MASGGFSVGGIQLAGDWSSRIAPFFYMNTDMADRTQELRMLVEEELEYDQLENE